MKLSLRNKFLIPTVALIAIELFVSTFVSYIISKNAIEKIIKTQLRQITDSGVNRLKLWITIATMDIDRRSEQNHYKIAVRDTFIGKASRKAADIHLKKGKQNNVFYESLNAANKNGEIIASSDQENIGKINVSDQLFFQESIKGKAFISDAAHSRFTGKPVFTVSSPIRERDLIVGVLFGTVNLEYFNKTYIDSVRVGQHGYAYMVSRKDVIIAHPDRSAVMRPDTREFHYDEKTGEGVIAYTYNGVKKLGAFRRNPETGWGIAVAVDYSDIMKPVKVLGSMNLLIAFMLIFIITVVIILIVNSIGEPVSELIKGTEIIGMGKLDHEIDVKSKDEIGKLALAFNKMVKKRKQSETRYKALFENMMDGVAVYQPVKNGEDFVFVDFNRAAEKISNVKKDAVIGQSVLKFFPGVRDFGLFDVFQKVFRTGEPHLHPVALYKDEHISHFSENSVFRLPSGEIIAVYSDDTDRKVAEEALKKTKNYLDNIINSSPSAIIGVDREGTVTVFNMTAEKLFNISFSQAIEKQFVEALPSYAEYFEDMKTVLQDKKPLFREKIQKQYNGEIHYSNISVYPLISDSPEGAVLRIDDVTERVRFEEMMIQTEKMVSVGELAAGMAHEINNPLGGILQSTQNILRRISFELPVNEKTALECGTDLKIIRSYLEKRNIVKFLEGIRESGKKASEIVSNMLNFSRRSESLMANVDLPNLLDKTVELATHHYDLKKKYDFRHIEIIRDFSPDLPKVHCIATEIEQVILNLLRNSAQAMTTGKKNGEISYIVLRLKQDSNMVQIEVEDNGPGMNEITRKRIFEPFFTTKEVGVGTGLGLSVSYFIIVNNHKGKMSVESVPGKGARFIIQLPLKSEYT
ncbi:MAG: PAS domain S-box protein [Desulfobacterales bacterium]|nr:PAS domain S-box protein [Desulfobacterales bacterium]